MPKPSLKRGLFVQERHNEADPAFMDRTVEMSREFLAEHSSDIVGSVDGTDEAFRPRKVIGDAWSLFQDEIPTAKVRYLGEDDPDSYDFDDLVDPPDDNVVQNIVKYGVEDPDEEGFFVDLGALEQLSDWSVSTFESPTTEAEDVPPAVVRAEASVEERMRRVNEIVARSRELAADPPVPSPPPAPAAPPRERYISSHEVEEWQLEGAWAPMADLPPVGSARPSPWAPRVAGVGLGITAGWAFATAAAWPIIAALVVGALALLLLSGRNG